MPTSSEYRERYKAILETLDKEASDASIPLARSLTKAFGAVSVLIVELTDTLAESERA